MGFAVRPASLLDTVHSPDTVRLHGDLSEVWFR